MLGLVVALTLFFRLGSIGLIDADEPRYAESAREMRQRGDLVVPHLNGEPRLNKPAFFYWSILASHSVVGVGETGSRLPSTLFAVLTLAMVFVFARRRVGPRAAFYAVLVLATSPLFFVIARLAIPDMTLTAFETMALLSFFEADRATQARAAPLAVGYGSLALAALTKGPVGVVVPALVLVVYLLWDGRVRDLRRLAWAPGLLLFAALAAPWYLAVGIKLGFREGFDLLFHETLYRYSTGTFHSEHPAFLAGVFLIGFLPWIGCLPGAIGLSLARPEPGDSGRTRFLLSWIAVVLVFFSLSPSKLPSYILPLAPAMALLVGGFLDRTTGAEAGAPDRRAGRLSLAIASSLLAVGAPIAGLLHGGSDGLPEARALGLSVGALALLPLATAFVDRLSHASLGLGLVLAASFAVAHRVAGPEIERRRSVKPLEPIVSSLGPDDPLILSGVDKPGLFFYSRRPVLEIDDLDDLAGWIRAFPRAFALVRDTKLLGLYRRLDPPAEVLYRGEGYALVRGRP